ncbi:sugar-binding protein [Lysinibacter cavernae]|uniref:LPXTG-motif cell wall-anchored protein n=1 Tax=Lysinibacter cavernae TaxID=1640652 RepID=A0A7X5QZK8_9MICO|nr:sugar-binding protein [Lysinibacter cavernae]NIH52934.1 LPXTG-motif cell wall-anchored protein [Lysinibacter cavernae]
MSTQRSVQSTPPQRRKIGTALLALGCSGALALSLAAPLPATAVDAADAPHPATTTQVASHSSPADLDIMFVGAHPDDESGRLSVYGEWAETFGARTGVVTVTRGEGGGNAVGPEEGPALGLIREAEERGAVSHASIEDVYNLDDVDFYYTVSEPLTREAWSEESLEKLVRVIRSTTPEVVVTMDPAPTPGNHGQHQEAALLALEAYRVAGDPAVFPGQIQDEGLQPWTVSKIFLNNARGSGAGTGERCPTVYTPVRPTQNIYGVWGGRTSAAGQTWAQVERSAQKQYASQGWAGFPDAPADPAAIGCDFMVQVESRVPYTRGDLSPAAASLSTMLKGASLVADGGLPFGTGAQLTGPDFQIVPGQSTEATVTVSAPAGSGLSNVTVTPQVPAGWTVAPATAAIGTVAPGATVDTAFTVTPATDAPTNSRSLVSAVIAAEGGTGYVDREFEVVPAVRGTQELLPQVRAFQEWATANNYPQMEGFVAPVLTLPSGGTRTVVVDVQNFSAASQSGEVSIALPAGFTATQTTQPYAGLAAGASTTVQFEVTNGDTSLATSNVGGDYAYTITTTAGATTSTAKAALELVPTASIGESSAAPTLDGVITPGEYTTGPIDISRLWEGSACTSAADCGGQAYMTRSGDDIYIAVNVIDDTLGTVLAENDCKRHWRTDSVEIALDPAGNSENTSTTFKAYVFPTTQGGQACFGRDADNNQGEGAAVAPGMEVATSVNEPYTGYVVETKIPASALPSTIDPSAMGLNIFVYDSDTQDLSGQTRLGWSTWGGVQGDPYRWGVATFDGWTPPAVATQAPRLNFDALSSLASPQSIEQSARTGVPLAGKPAATAANAGTAVQTWVEGETLLSAVDIRSAGLVRLFALAEDGTVVASSEQSVDAGTRRIDVALPATTARAETPPVARVAMSFASDAGGSTASVVPLAESRIASATAVAVTPATVRAGEAQSVSVSVATEGLPATGSVELFAGTTSLGAGELVGGSVAFDLVGKLPIGSNGLTARYSGDDVTLASEGGATAVVTDSSTTTPPVTPGGTGGTGGGSAGGPSLTNTGGAEAGWAALAALALIAAGGFALRRRAGRMSAE